MQAERPGELVCIDTFYVGNLKGVGKLWQLSDGGSEFKAQFDQACRELNVRYTRTKPRHAWTNGFVERLQGTILHEHWRIAFRRRYFRRRHQLQASLASFLEFYNFQRPHQGYRTKGRIPSEIFGRNTASTA